MTRCVARLLASLLLGVIAVGLAGSPALAQNTIDPTRIRIVDRLKVAPSSTFALGSPFDVRIKFPKDGVLKVTMRQIDERGRFDHAEGLPIVLDRNGQTVAKITPLAMGAVHFIINAGFSDSGLSVADFTVKVGPPSAPPQKLLADLDFVQNYVTRFVISANRVGRRLRPVAFFDSAPGHEFDVQGAATFRLLPSKGPPVVTLTVDGTLSALRVGTAMAEVSFAGTTTPFPIEVVR